MRSSNRRKSDQKRAIGCVAALTASAICIALAPQLMPPDYSWVAHTTSESAAQGIEGAWLARLGFLLWGLAVLSLATRRPPRWGDWGTRLHGAFGALMIATAAFSDRPWQAGVTFDPVEDLLHTATSTGLGFAFAFGVLAVMLQTLQSGSRRIAPDIVAVAAATLVPLGMSVWGGIDGLLQRLLFVVAYGWYLREALPRRL